jgi:nonribosomal peptide synthetase DhbF
LHEAFARAAAARPDRPALVRGTTRFSYVQLARRAAAVAGGLAARITPEELVGLCAPRSPGAIATLLGILGAGGAYAPLDPRQPVDRLCATVERTALRILFAARTEVPRLRALLPATVEVLPVEEEFSEGLSGDAPPWQPPTGKPGALAYVMHTSGSTGRAKGVLVEHGSVLALVHNGVPGLDGEQVVLQLAPLHVDPSVFEVFGALLNGGTLVLPENTEPSIHDIGREVVRHHVTVLRLAAPLFRLAVEHVLPSLRGLRTLISGGDRPDPDAIRRALNTLPDCAVVNGYGPTETTVFACWQVMRGPDAYASDWDTVPIGRPVAGAAVLLLDAHREPVSPGEEGELCVGGPGLARGYLGVDGPSGFVDEPRLPGGRGYLTGDRVRQLPDGSLSFVGRLDDQVKIRGYRVEPLETEHALLAHPSVQDAAVVPVHDGLAGNRLAAFAVLTAPAVATEEELRDHLLGALPSHMVPATVRVLTELPTTANGKTDRAQLAKTTATRPPLPEPAGPAPGPDEESSGTEVMLRRLWQDVLGVAVTGLDTSFFALGGDSLTAMAVLARLERETGVTLQPSALFDAPTPRALAELIDGTSPGADAGDGAAEPDGNEGPLPLLPGQAGIWFERELAGGERYNIARTFLVHGPLDASALRLALDLLADRQRALRAVVRPGPDGWVQELTGDPAAAVREVDLSGLPDGEQSARLRELTARSATFDPQNPPPALIRTLLITLGAERAIVHFDIHHVIADDWSLDLFFDELSALYATSVRGLPPVLPQPAPDYAGHIRALAVPRPHLLREATAYWRRTLEGWSGELGLTTDFPRPALLSGRGDTVRAAFGTQRSERVAQAARRHGISRFMLFTAAVYVVLSHHTEQDDIRLGALAGGRGGAGVDRLIGYFGTILALRITADPDTTVSALLQRVRESCSAAYRHQKVPFQEVLRRLGPMSQTGATMPFPVVVNHRGAQPRPLRLAGTSTVPQDEPAGDSGGFAKFELGFSFQQSDDTDTELALEFSTDLYHRDVMEELVAQTLTVLDLLADDPQATLGRLDLSGGGRLPAERPADVPVPDATLHDLFAQQAAARPDKVAVIGADGALTYRDLDRLSDAVAARLISAGVRAGDRVAICLDRSPMLAVALLGALKTGATYVPLDPAYPVARLRFTVEDAQAGFLVSEKKITDRLRETVPAGTALLDISLLTEPVDAAHPVRPPARTQPSDLAYIIYTSGSTGQPRGAMIEHRSVVNTLYGNLRRYPLDDTDVWLQLTSPGFDVAVLEQFMPLVSGATLVYCDDAKRRDAHALTGLLHEHGVTVLVTVPSLLRALARPDLAGVRVLIMAGEPADVHDTRHFARDRVVVNGYGPTEAAILATTYRAHPGDTRARVPIGTPLPGTSCVVIDRRGRPAATGVPGELYLGGAGVGRGYWNNPEQTRRLFTAMPVVGEGHFYRTGDRVRRLHGGDLDYLGRLDDQIKLRGFRIELGEIEAVLASLDGITEAVAVITGTGADAELFAFVVGAADGAREQLARVLPAPMVPRAVLPVTAIPVNSHGKADRKRLARLVPEMPAPGGSSGEALETPLEHRVHALWQSVLGTDNALAADTDFFAAGGHSLRVIRFIGLVEDELAVRLGVREFLGEPTIRATARRLGQLLTASPEPDGRPDDRSGAVMGDSSGDLPAVRLDPALVFSGRPDAPGREPGPVLLTGATGFVGTHLLRELLDRTDDDVLCLVRAASVKDARTRLHQAAQRFGLDTTNDPRIVPVPGDLAIRSLGLDPGALRQLARRVRTVLHAGAQVHHLSGYEHLAAANVRGTEELLRLLAVDGGPSRFHHISTVGVFKAPGFRTGSRTVTETTAVDGEHHSRGQGYTASKWAAELLVAEAAARGADTRVHRLGRAGGSTVGGATSLDDMLSRVLVSSAHLGCYPVHPGLVFDVLPVDVMARTVVALLQADFPPGAVHHVHQPGQADLAAYMAGHDRRHATTTVPVVLDAWLERLDRVAASGTVLPAYVYREHLRDIVTGSATGEQPALRFDNSATVRDLRRLGVFLPALDATYIDRCWQWLDQASAGEPPARDPKDTP